MIICSHQMCTPIEQSLVRSRGCQDSEMEDEQYMYALDYVVQ